MSLSNPKTTNPCKVFLSYKDGAFVYYDKSLGEKGENVKIALPCRFIVLDQLSTIKGWSDSDQAGIYSNEIHSITEETLKVKCFKGDFSVVGKYNDIKNEIKSAGGKFCTSVYAAMKNNKGGFDLINFQFIGAALGAWFEFQKTINLQICGVEIQSEYKTDKKGKVEYKIPIFKKLNLNPEQISIAIEMDKALQKYFIEYKRHTQEESTVNSEIQEPYELPPSEILNEDDTFRNPQSNEVNDLPF